MGQKGSREGAFIEKKNFRGTAMGTKNRGKQREGDFGNPKKESR